MLSLGGPTLKKRLVLLLELYLQVLRLPDAFCAEAVVPEQGDPHGELHGDEL